MRDSISVTWIFQIVILFIFLFTAIMCLTINNSNAFAVKDAIVDYIQVNNGNFKYYNKVDQELIDVIQSTSYKTEGKCDEGYIGYDRNGLETNSSRASFCVQEVNVGDGIDNYLRKKLGNSFFTDNNGLYYRVMVFYQLDIPVFNFVFNFNTKGETRIVYN